MNITKTHIINESVKGIRSNTVSRTSSGVKSGDGSMIEDKVSAGRAARESFDEAVQHQREMMNRPSHVVSPEIKAAALTRQEAYLKELEATGGNYEYQMTTRQIIELIEADKLSEESLEMLSPRA